MRGLILSLVLSVVAEQALATGSFCESYKAEQAKEFKEVNPLKQKINAAELKMIQKTIAWDLKKPVTTEEALNVFLDLPHTSNAGSLTYYKDAQGRVGVLALYFPGENPYGLLFEITHVKKGQTTYAQYARVAHIIDGDTTCN